MKKKFDRRIYVFLIAPALLLTMLMSVYPLFTNLWYSFQSVGPMFIKAKGFVGLDNYVEILSPGSRFYHSLIVTIGFSGFVVIGQLLLGVILALAIDRLSRFQGLLTTLLLVPWVTTPVVKGLIWSMLLNYRWGVINYLLSSVGIPGQLWLGRPLLAQITIIVIGIWQATPRTALIALAALKTLPQDILECAELEGATEWEKFFKIKLPLIMPAVVVSLIFSTMEVMRTFDWVFVMTGGGPGSATDLLSISIRKLFFDYWEIGLAAASSVIFAGIMLFISIFYLKKVQEK